MDVNTRYRISLEDLFSSSILKAEKHGATFEKRIDTINRGLGSLKTEILGALGIYGGFSFLKDSADQFLKVEKAAQSLRFSIGSRGGLTSDFAEMYKQSQEFEDKGIFDDTDILRAQKSLIDYGISIKQVKDTMETFLDVAAQKGQSIDEVISAVGMAASGGRAMALKQYGISFIELEKNMKNAGAQARNFDKIVSELTKNFKGGMEDVVNNTDWGKVKNFEQAFGNFKEELGREVMQGFKLALPYLKEFLLWLREGLRWIVQHKDALLEWAKSIGTVILSLGALKAVIGLATGAQDLFNGAIKANPFTLAAASVALLIANYDKLLDLVKKLRGEEKWHTSTLDTEGTRSMLGNSIMRLQREQPGTAEENQKRALEFLNAQAAKAREEIRQNKDMMNISTGSSRSEYKEMFENEMKKLKVIKEEIRKYSQGLSLRTGSAPDFGSGISEPAVSKIKQITINVNQPLQNMKITSQTIDGALDQLGPKISEFLVSLVTDAAIVATE